MASWYILLIGVLLIPRLCSYISVTALRGLGKYLQHTTRARRQAIWSRVKAEEIQRQTDPVSQKRAEDDGWEKIDGDAVRSVESSRDIPDEEWEGIVGFFHPFW